MSANEATETNYDSFSSDGKSDQLLDSQVTRFIESIEDSHPLLSAVEKIALNNKEEFNLPTKFRDIYDLQKVMTSAVAENWGFSSESLHERYWIKLIDKAISKTLPYIPEKFLCNPIEWVEQIHPFIIAVKETVINEDTVSIFTEESGFEDDDIILHIKIPLLKSTFRLNEMTLSLPIGHTTEEIVRWGYEQIIELSKDLAFNWSKRCGIENRQRLFYTALPICGDVVCNSILTIASENIHVKMVPNMGADVIKDMPDLEKLITDNSMGHTDLDNLAERVGSFIIGTAMSKLTSDRLTHISMPIWYGSCLRGIERMALRSWQILIDERHSKLDGMDDEELSAWLENDESKTPISLDLFTESLQSQIDESKPGSMATPINLELATNSARESLATLWGMSDAICQING